MSGAAFSFGEQSRVRFGGVKVEKLVSRQSNKVPVRGYGNVERAVRKPKIGNCVRYEGSGVGSSETDLGSSLSPLLTRV